MTLEAWVKPTARRAATAPSSSRSSPATSSTASTPTTTPTGPRRRSPSAAPTAARRHGASRRPAAGHTSPPPTTAPRERLYVNGTLVSTLAVSGSILTSTGAAQDRRQLDLGRVVQRPDRRGPRLQPRRSAPPRSATDMNTSISAPDTHAAERTRHADRNGRPRQGQPQLGRGDRQRRRHEVRRLPLDRPPASPRAPANRIAQPTGTSYTDTGLAAGTYYYKVTAEDAAGNVGPPQRGHGAATADTTPPTAPTGLTATGAPGQVALSWTAATDNGGSPATTSTARPRPASRRARRTGSRSRRARATPTPASPPAPTTTRSPPRTTPATSSAASNEATATVPDGAAGRASSPPTASTRAAGTTTADQSGHRQQRARSTTRPGPAQPRASSATRSPSTARTRVTVADSSSLDLTTGMTLEAWVKPTRRQRLPHARRQGAAGQPRLRPLREQRRQPARGAGHRRRHHALLAARRRSPTDAWTHLAATYDGTTRAPLRQRHAGLAALAIAGSIAHVDGAAADRRQLDLGRVVQRPDRRGARLQPRAQRGRDPERHEPRRSRAPDTTPPTAPGTLPRPAASARSASAGAPRPTTSASRKYDVYRSTTSGFTPSAGNRIAQPTGTSYTDTGLAPAPTTTRSPPRTPPATSARPATRRTPQPPPTRRRRPSVVTAPAAGATVSRHGDRHRDRDRQRLRRGRAVQARRREPRQPRTQRAPYSRLLGHVRRRRTGRTR